MASDTTGARVPSCISSGALGSLAATRISGVDAATASNEKRAPSGSGNVNRQSKSITMSPPFSSTARRLFRLTRTSTVKAWAQPVRYPRMNMPYTIAHSTNPSSASRTLDSVKNSENMRLAGGRQSNVWFGRSPLLAYQNPSSTQRRTKSESRTRPNATRNTPRLRGSTVKYVAENQRHHSRISQSKLSKVRASA
jgi:hypothetical protein